jgi:hypothetical protein
MLIVVPLLAAVFGVLYQQELRALGETVLTESALADLRPASLRPGFLKAYMALLVIAGIVAWWLVLAHQSRKVAQEESNRQTHLLVREIELHRKTDRALQAAKQTADQAREQADQANQARAATSAPSAMNCARPSTAFWLCATDGRGRRRAAVSPAGGCGHQAGWRTSAFAIKARSTSPTSKPASSRSMPSRCSSPNS